MLAAEQLLDAQLNFCLHCACSLCGKSTRSSAWLRLFVWLSVLGVEMVLLREDV